jgi:hypothetical protein
MGVMDFINNGQQRRAWLDENVSDFVEYITPPNLRPTVEMAAQVNPIQGMGDMMGDFGVAVDPSRSMDERRAAATSAAVEGLLALAPAAVGYKMGRPAAEGVIDTLAGYAPDMDEALGDFWADEAGALNLWDRIDFSTPKSWRDPKFEKPQWHPVSSVSMDRPASEVVALTDDLGLLSPEAALTIEDLQGRVLTPALGDRTIAGVNVLGYDDVIYDAPVRSQGGRDFMREAGTGLWASEKGPMQQKSNAIRGLLEAGDDPALVYTAMGAQSGDFSTIMKDAMMGQFQPDRIADDAARKFDARMEALGVKGWPGTKSGQVDEALTNMTGSDRWLVWQEMDKAAYRDAGFPDVGKTRISITDPMLLDVDPFTSGLNVGRPDAQFGDDIFQAHPSYSHQIGGEYEGSLGNLPGQIIWRDFFDGRRMGGSSAASDQRAFMMQSPRMTQRVDQQMVDEVNEWLSGRRQ